MSQERGDATRRRILEAALVIFSRTGFRAATTREIAAAAEVHLPSIKYYFGDKEGLYLACAEFLVASHAAQMQALVEEASRVLASRPVDPEAARRALRALMAGLVEMFFRDQAPMGIGFALRELQEPGPAFELIFAGVWGPGIDRCARLIRAMCPALSLQEARLEALMLIGRLSAVTAERQIALRAMGWEEIGKPQVALIRAAMLDAVNRLAGGPRGG